MRVFIGLFLSGLLCMPAAADTPDLRELIECAPSKKFVKLANGLAELDASRTDTINTKPSFTLAANDGGALPSRIFVRSETGETDLVMSTKGEVTNFIEHFTDDKSAELCIEDPSRVGVVKDKGAFGLSMEFNMNFLNSSGIYTMDEIKDGLKDGKAALKKIISGPVSILVPKLSHLYVEFGSEAAAPSFEVFKNGETLGEVETVRLGPAYMIAVDDLKDLEMDELRINGGAHTLSPSLSPKRMAKLMAGDTKPD